MARIHIVAGIAAAVALAGSAGATELIANGGFESGDWSGWLTFGQGWRIGGTDEARSGDFAAANDVTAGQVDEWRGVYQNVPAVPGRVYSAACFMRSTNQVEASESWLEIQWLDANGSVILQHTTPVLPADQGYARARIPYMVAPFGAATVSVRGIVRMLQQPSANDDIHLFDDFSCILQPTGPIVNASFETADLSGWEFFGPGWRANSWGDNHWGLWGAVNDVLPQHSVAWEEWRGIYQNVPVTPGQRYAVGCSIRAVSVQASRSWLEVQWLDANNQVIGQLQSEYVTADQPFRRVVLSDLVAPANAVRMSVRGIVQMLGQPPDPDFHIFDDFVIQPMPALDIRPDPNDGASVRWALPVYSEALQQSTNLVAGVWRPIQENPAPLTNGWRVGVGRTGPLAFFRLTMPE